MAGTAEYELDIAFENSNTDIEPSRRGDLDENGEVRKEDRGEELKGLLFEILRRFVAAMVMRHSAFDIDISFFP